MDIADTNPFKKLAQQERSQQRVNGKSKNHQIDSDQIVPYTSDESGDDSGGDYVNLVDSYTVDNLNNSTDSLDSSDNENNELPLLNTDTVRSKLLNGSISAKIPNSTDSLKAVVKKFEMHSQIEDNNVTGLQSSNSTIPPKKKTPTTISPQMIDESPNLHRPDIDASQITEQSINTITDQPTTAITAQTIEQTSSLENSITRPPLAPTRPPVLPKRRPSLIKKTSSLDPGSSSTVGSYTFYGDRIPSNGTNNPVNPILPRRQSVTNYLPSLPQRPPSISSHSSIQINTNSDSTHISSTPISSPIIPNLVTHSLPKITITPGGNYDQKPVLPKRPQLPNKPKLTNLSNTSASELLRNYSRRTSNSNIVSNHNTSNSSTTSNGSGVSNNAMLNNNITNNNTSIYEELNLDEDSLQSLGIDEEMLRQQRDLEERFERQHKLEQETRNKLLELERNNSISNDSSTNDHDVLTISTNDNFADDESMSINTNESEVPDDVSQLEIPTNLSRNNSLVSTDVNSDNRLTPTTSSTSANNIDIFANGDLTEEEFINLLPPVPKYTKTASDTELSIPNGKAINIMCINENQPDEKPPVYTPVSERLKTLINRPQFSQTGGDSYTYRREQQREQREQQREQREQLYQSQMESHRELQDRRSRNPSSRHRSQREIRSGRIPPRRLPPLHP